VVHAVRLHFAGGCVHPEQLPAFYGASYAMERHPLGTAASACQRQSSGLILFGAFGLYAVHAMSSQNARGVRPSQFRRPLFNDAAVVVAGLILYWVFLHFHAKLFGVPVIY